MSKQSELKKEFAEKKINTKRIEKYSDVIEFREQEIQNYIRYNISKPMGNICVGDIIEVEELQLQNASGINYLNDLNSFKNVRRVILRDRDIKNLTPLICMDKLELIDIDSMNLKDISVLGRLRYPERIRRLSARMNQIENISPLKRCVNIEELYLSRNKIQDISSIKNFTKLSELSLYKNKINDIGTFKGENLWSINTLYIGDNPFEDVSCIANLSNLNRLSLGGERYVNLDTLQQLEKLRSLEIEDSGITNIKFLQSKNFESLTYLNLNNNIIKDVSPIIHLDNLENLFLRNNKIIGIEQLLELKSNNIFIGGNKISEDEKKVLQEVRPPRFDFY